VVKSLETSAGVPRLPTRTQLAARAGAAVGALSRHLGRGTGSVIGGRVLLAIDPRALSKLGAGRRIALVSGTNGKTTTTTLLRAALATRGPVVSNTLGANLPPGLAAVLAAAPPDALLAALEVDEAWLAPVVTATDPRVVVLLNLSRDQLDRNNEVRRLSASWRALIAQRSAAAGPGSHEAMGTRSAGEAETTRPHAAPFEAPMLHVVANADDPLVAWAAQVAPSVTWVGAGQRWTADAAGCPSCGGRIEFSDDPGGPWSCSECSFRRPDLDVWLDGEAVVSGDGGRVTPRLQLPGRINLANGAMAIAAAAVFGVDRAEGAAAMAATTEVMGRYRTVEVDGVAARLLLAKNPAGWLETFDLLAPPPTPVVVAINARIADGKDPSWLWDVPFERLQGRMVVATGERSADLAVRLRYADVEHRRQPDLVQAVIDAGPGPVDVVANYTSFQALNRRLEREH
jgi:UDP-N-acetylmuramyl tripeptide synthase